MARLSDLVREQVQPSPFLESVRPWKGNGTAVLSSPPAPAPPAQNVNAQDHTDWYRLALDELPRVMQSAQEGAVHTLGDLHRIAAGIVESVTTHDRLLTQVLSGSGDSTLVGNLVNVAVLATRLATGLRYDTEDLERLALAALVHDVGMFALPTSLLTKSEPLNSSERAAIERHAEVGAEILSGLGSGYAWLAHVTLQEHERWLGQGYPMKHKGPQIHPYAQVIGVADVFDALINLRPYKRPFLPHEAVREVLVTEKAAFSRDILKALVEQVSLYPLGTCVRLNSGEVGVVTELNPRFPLRPVIRVRADGDPDVGARKRIDLCATTVLHIVEVVKPGEIGG